MEYWNQVAMMRCLWNLSMKMDSLWVKWVHAYYVKNATVWTTNVPAIASWILKDILVRREDVNQHLQIWNDMLSKGKFSMKKLYDHLLQAEDNVNWSHLIQHNVARPRAIVCLWLVCHNRLATKARLKWLGLMQEDCCSLCNDHIEDINHLFINCRITKHIWNEVLNWLEVNHKSTQWQEELNWIIQHTKGKGLCASILKIAIAETVYGIWMYRNERIFGSYTNEDTTKVVHNIIDAIVYRGWLKDKYRRKIALLMM
ncbi:uncharacterized protein LOC131615223 [Vicia villosa]|uniref:uncharacterized protein LOC131615223 n=1 Tax=Vicia villosa TaxID=3911 RepID=UPI00273CB878|nr:uncharacterized protein LOC131615223 [Vicia villosa]